MSSNLSLRYLLDISKVKAAGFAAADVQMTNNFSQGATVSGPQAWGAARGIYVVAVDFAGTAAKSDSTIEFDMKANIVTI